MSIKLFTIPNITGVQVTAYAPEDVPCDLVAPKGMSKTEFGKWVSNPTTHGIFVSGFAGLNPHTRVSKQATNPAYEMHAFVADYDTPLDEQELKDGVSKRAKSGLAPAILHRSYSGRGRVIWLFEKPLMLVPGLTEQFLKVLAKELGARDLFPSFDETCLRPEHYFHWHPPILKASKDRVGENTLQYLMGRALDLSRKYKGEADISIPLERVHAEVQDRWPGRWTGNFTPGARGCCFWDPDSKNPTSAIVTETGMVAFSQPKPFFSWSDLLGVDWVRQFEEDKFGAPVSAYFFDGRYYWHKGQGGLWGASTKEDARHNLMGDYGLSGAPVTSTLR